MAVELRGLKVKRQRLEVGGSRLEEEAEVRGWTFEVRRRSGGAPRSVRAVWRGWSREFTTHGIHILAILSSPFIVLVFCEWAQGFEQERRKRKKTQG
jgi:hypothetical protein